MNKSMYELQAIANQLNPDGSLKPLPPNSTNVYPGKRMGLTPEEVQEYIQRQKKSQGYEVSIATGDNNSLRNVELPGDARVMLGFALDFLDTAGNPVTGKLKMELNNEVMIDDTNITFFDSNFTDSEYYFYPRPMSGQTKLKISVMGVANAYTLIANFVYL